MQLPSSMHAMVLEQPKTLLQYKNMPMPLPNENQVLVKIMACGVCRTDLHVIDGELPSPKLPLIPGHEIIGRVIQTGSNVTNFHENDIVGIPWLAYTCGHCKYCLQGKENLCEQALFTGYTVNGGYAEYTVAYENYCFKLPSLYAQPSAAPLLCAGLIGFRSYRMIPFYAEHIGLYGFGAAAHLLIQLACFQKKKIYAFTREGDEAAQQFALQLGAVWAGSSLDKPPVTLDAAILFAPVGDLIPKALTDVDKGGTVICGGIHMSNIPSFPYHILWNERSIKSVANLTRQDGIDFLQLAEQVPITTQVKLFALQEANEALQHLRNGTIQGAAVLVMNE